MRENRVAHLTLFKVVDSLIISLGMLKSHLKYHYNYRAWLLSFFNIYASFVFFLKKKLVDRRLGSAICRAFKFHASMIIVYLGNCRRCYISLCFAV